MQLFCTKRNKNTQVLKWDDRILVGNRNIAEATRVMGWNTGKLSLGKRRGGFVIACTRRAKLI